ncbi:hypothetical protein AB0C31_49580, partial [Actinoplanes philippinensis]
MRSLLAQVAGRMPAGPERGALLRQFVPYLPGRPREIAFRHLLSVAFAGAARQGVLREGARAWPARPGPEELDIVRRCLDGTDLDACFAVPASAGDLLERIAGPGAPRVVLDEVRLVPRWWPGSAGRNVPQSGRFRADACGEGRNQPAREVFMPRLADLGVAQRLSSIVVTGVLVAGALTGIGLWSQDQLSDKQASLTDCTFTKAALNHLDTREAELKVDAYRSTHGDDVNGDVADVLVSATES